MKKSTKIIISIAIIITILIIGAFVVYIMCKGELHHFTISDIDKDRVICDSGYIDLKRRSREQNIITEEELQEAIQLKWGYCYFLKNNILVVDSKWHITDITTLNVGDYIQVFNINPMNMTALGGGYPQKIENVKFVRVFKNSND